MLKTVPAVLLLAAAATPVFAQQFASLSVSATDVAGHALSQARISVRNIATGASRDLGADHDGHASFQGLQAGPYMITIEQEGFSRTQSRITLSVAQEASVSLKLQVATVVQTVEVGSSVEGVNSGDTQTSQVISPRQIESLPISDRDFIDFVTLTPTANIGRSTSMAAQSAFQETVLQISFGVSPRRIAPSTAWMEWTTRPASPACSAKAHHWIGCRSFAWFMVPALPL